MATLKATKTHALTRQHVLTHSHIYAHPRSTFTKGEIVKAREVYVPCAKRGALLFFAMAGLPMLFDEVTGMTYSIYEVSLDSYLKVG